MGMSTKKKRRNNDGSSQPVRRLDDYFVAQPTTSSTADQSDQNNQSLSDEQLARQLQAEWDAEAQRQTHTQFHKQIQPQSHPQSQPQPQHTQEPQPTALALQSTTAEEDAVSADTPLDESPLDFHPARHLPALRKHWNTATGGHATYALLTRCFVLVNRTASRIKIVDTLVNLLRTLIEGDPESLLPAVWLTTNAISPSYVDRELGLGSAAVSKALKQVCGLDNSGLKALYSRHGDPGDVAFEAKKRQAFTLRKPKPLTIKTVFESLVKIADSRGNGSVEAKQRLVERLVQDARGPEESRYVVRTLVQHLRIGAVKTTMLIALSRAFLLSKPLGANFKTREGSELAKLKKEELVELYSRNEEIVKACFARRPNYNDLIPALLDVGVCDELLIRCPLALHIPLRPMLGSITRDLGQMITKLQGRDFSCEYKYDGQRAQMHCDNNGNVTIFSRHLEVMTDKYPDLVALVPKIRGDDVASFILEGEVVAIDRDSGELKTFQTLSNRARKDVAVGKVTIDVCLFAFDLMYLNGEELLDRSFRERRSLLRSLFVEIPHRFTWAKNLDATSTDTEAVQTFFKSAISIKCEGIMVKILDNLPNPKLQRDHLDIPFVDQSPDPSVPRKSGSIFDNVMPNSTDSASKNTVLQPCKGRRKALLATYEPDKRLESWLKVKKDYDTCAETLDLIPIAGFHGQGRKAKWWSPILLAVRNSETGSLEAVTKCMSGFTDAFYRSNRAKYDKDDPQCANVLPDKPSYVEYSGGSGLPDVWFEPQEVWEVAFADLTLSPTYTAAIGIVSEDRGLSTRFPRFLKVREDKGIDEATEAGELASIYRKQEDRLPKQGATNNEIVKDQLE